MFNGKRRKVRERETKNDGMRRWVSGEVTALKEVVRVSLPRREAGAKT